MFLKLFIAMFLGMAIGIERIIAHKTAGMRTYALVSMGAALFTILAEATAPGAALIMSGYSSAPITAAIITGVGFLGTGLAIWHDGKPMVGLTTAMGLWISAGIGMAVGFGLCGLAVMATILTLFVFIVLWFIEQKIKHLPIAEEGIQNK